MRQLVTIFRFCGAVLLLLAALLAPVKAAGASQSDPKLVYLPLIVQRPPDPPHLLTTQWDQVGEFARFSPDNWRIGCWSTALAQILYYHRLLPTGSVSYQTTTGYSINENLAAYTFDWDLFVDTIRYDTPEASIDQVAKYSYFTSVVIQKNFGTDTYLINNAQRAAEIASHYGVSAAVYSTVTVSFEKTKEVVMAELDAARPLMMYMRSLDGSLYHAVVLDAYQVREGALWVHINMGHGGYEDGWYNYSAAILGYDDTSYRVLLTVKKE